MDCMKNLGSAEALDESAHFDEGFSLIELMVVMLVLAVLLSIAIPTFLGTTATADNRSAQSNLITAFTDAKTQFQNGGQTYFVGGTQDAAAFAGLLDAAQLDLRFRAGSLGPSISQGSSDSMSTISVAVSADGNGLVLAAYSVPGNCFYVVDNTEPLSAASISTSPYAGTTVVTTTTSSPASAGSIGLPTAVGTNYVEVTGDTTKADCNAYTPKSNGAPGTVQYSRDGFPN
jgi:type IV pilus assembly protein PilA